MADVASTLAPQAAYCTACACADKLVSVCHQQESAKAHSFTPGYTGSKLCHLTCAG